MTATASPANAATLSATDPQGDVKIYKRAKKVPKPKSIDAYKVTTFWDDASNSASVTLKVSDLVNFGKRGNWRQTFDFTMSRDGNFERFFYINKSRRNVCGVGSSLLEKSSGDVTCRANYKRNTIKILFDLDMVGGSQAKNLCSLITSATNRNGASTRSIDGSGDPLCDDYWPAAVISDSGFDGFLYAAVAGWR